MLAGRFRRLSDDVEFFIAKLLKNDYSQSPDMWQKIQLIVIKIMSLGYTG
ncbi:hypothetical protein [Symbiopectobacterium sp. RP]